MIRRSLNLFFFAMILLVSSASLWAGDVVDRIVASVNGQIILQSDWEDAVRFQPLEDARTTESLGTEERTSALDHLVDQELLKEQMNSLDFHHATDRDVDKRVEEIRKQYPGSDSAESWNAVLSRYGFTEAELRKHVATELDLMKLVDSHLRPNVNIDPNSIESYYSEQLLPQLKQSGAEPIPLAEVTPQIKELLTQQRVNELLLAWLQNLRSGSDIRTSTPSGGSLQ